LGQDVVIFIISNMAAAVRAGQTSVGILSYLVHQQSISSDSGRTFFKSPNIGKPYRKVQAGFDKSCCIQFQVSIQ
jgi:hypothetical protein